MSKANFSSIHHIHNVSSEGEQVIAANGFGAYGDEHDAFGAEADFGNIGMGSIEERDVGETDSFDSFTMGDFDDAMGSDDMPVSGFMDGAMGKSRNKLKNKLKKAKKIRNLGKRKKKTAPAPVLTTAQKTIAVPMAVNQRRYLNQGVRNWQMKHKDRIAAIQYNAIKSGKPVPSAISLMPAHTRANLVQQATIKATAVAAASATKDRSGNPSFSLKTAVQKALRYGRPGKNIANDSAVLRSNISEGVVVAQAGQNLIQSDVDSSASTAQVVAFSQGKRSPYAHPMLALVSPMSGGMGFSLSAFLDKAKIDAQAALKTASSNLLTQAKTDVGALASKLGGNLLADKSVQSFAAQKAKEAAAQSMAQKLLDPEFQAKAAKVAGGGAMVLAGLAAAYFIVPKLMKKK